VHSILILLAFFFAVTVCSPIHISHLYQDLSNTNELLFPEFENWARTYGRTYSHSEQIYRFEIWKENKEYIENNNADPESSFKLAMNQFGDMTKEEFAKAVSGLRSYNNISSHGIIFDGNPKKAVDWRKKNAVTPVKNQGMCGSCWSFSATGAIEGAWALKKGKLVSLSEQNLVDCSNSEGNEGCGGGLMDYAFQYVLINKGLDTEASYPYRGQGGQCNFTTAQVGATISSFVDVLPRQNETALQIAMGSTPISVGIDASHSSFQFYHSGVYFEPACSTTALDHGVLAVGYGTINGSDYWIVKNSWGASWGDNGYILMARNKQNHCGIATLASYPVV